MSCCGNSKFSAKWVKKQSKPMEISVHRMKLSVENRFCMLEEGWIVTRHWLCVENCTVGPDKLQHSVCQCRIAGFNITNDINQWFTNPDNLVSQISLCKIEDRIYHCRIDGGKAMYRSRSSLPATKLHQCSSVIFDAEGL